MGFSVSTPSSATALNQINLNTDGLEALLGLIQLQTDQLEVPIANMALNLTSIEALTLSLQALQTVIRDAVQTTNSSGTVTVNENAAALLVSLNSALTLLTSIGNNTDQIEALLTRLAGESTVITALSDPHYLLPDALIHPLPTHIANAVFLVGIKADGTDNAGPIKYGYNSTDLRLTLYPGGSTALDAPQGKKIDTAGIWLKGVAGDGVVIALMN
jgi:hypothetical protein